jgi:methanethiol S-methyltransferase
VRATALLTWGGGAAFVASLACCLWLYLVRLGSDAPFAGAGAIAWNTALVTFFAFHHSIFARDWIKTPLRGIVGEHLRSVFVWTASLLLITVCIAWRRVGATIFHAAGVAAVACGLVQLSGLGLIAWSVAQIDPMELAGIRPRPSDGVQTGGPYRFVRHPVYTGWMLATFATPHLTGDRLTFAVLTSIYLVIAIPWEEGSLRAAFGEAYARYTADVPWRVIPFIY